MEAHLLLSRSHVNQIISHVSAEAPLEACGLLAGKDSSVEKVLFVLNQAQSPVRFVMDPLEQLKAFDWIESNGLELLGIFHSHPAGPDTVSATDIAEASYDVVHVICSRIEQNWTLRGFWIENEQAREVVLQIKS